MLQRPGPNFPANMKISDNYTPQWSADGKKLFFGIAPKRYQGKSRAEVTADVDIWHWKDQEIQSRQKNRYYLNRSRTYLCVWWPEENRWRQLADSSLFDIAGISADGACFGCRRSALSAPLPRTSSGYLCDTDGNWKTYPLVGEYNIVGFFFPRRKVCLLF